MRYATTFVALLVLASCALPESARSEELPLTSRNVELTGKLTLDSARKVAGKLIELDSISNNTIYLLVDAHGDSVEAAFSLIDVIGSIASPVHAVVRSRAYDMAAVVAAFCQKVYIYPHAVLLLRAVSDVSTELKPPEKPSESFLKPFIEQMHSAIAKRLGMKRSKFEEKVKDGWWLTAEAAVKAGVADEIVSSITYREIIIEKTEIKKTVTTVEEKQIPNGPARKKPVKRIKK